MKNRLLLLLLSTGIISIILAFTFQPNPNPFFQKLQEKLTAHQTASSPEKLYLQFDRSLYKPGEGIWFKAYLRDANSLKASEKSDILYVELWNPKGTMVKKLHLLAKDGLASGDFALDENAAGGIYTVKAYTNWQRNTNDIFEREITVQKTVLPRLNMKLQFERKAFGVGDEVIARLDLQSLANEALADYDFDFVAQLDGKNILEQKAKTDEKGRVYLTFNLPPDLETNDGLLNVLIPYQGRTESISRAIPIVLGEIDLQFFPEGGDQVVGIENNVAFKALNEFGKPADIVGVIEDENGTTITTFESFHQGMGAFELLPEKGNRYFARLTQPTGNEQRFELPKPKKEGYVLKIKEQKEHFIKVDAISSAKKKAYLIAQARGKIYFQDSLQSAQTFHIPTKNLPIGITQLTLFDEWGNAQCERLVFVNPHRQLNVQMTTNKEKYLPREQVKLDILVTDENQKPVEGNFSLAVADEKLLSFADDKQGHILSHMLLESDVKGEIVEPNFYFDAKEPKAREALDYLLMTQGWRRFSWEAVLAEKELDFAYEVERAEVKILVKDGEEKPIKNASVSVIGKTEQAYKTDAKGQVILEKTELPIYVNINAPKRYKVGEMQRAFNIYGQHTVFLLETKGFYQRHAVNRNGNIAMEGKVMAESGEPLIGTNILLTNQKNSLRYGTVSDIDGYFKLEDVPEGMYVVEWSYTGYTTKKIDLVEVKKTKTQVFKAVLEEAYALEEVVVTRFSRRRFKKSNNKNKEVATAEVNEAIMQEPPRTAEPPSPPPVIEEVPQEEIAEDDEIVFLDQTIEEEMVAREPTNFGEFDGVPPPPPPPPPPAKEQEIFRVVEEMPRFPGCEHLAAPQQQRCSNERLMTYIYSQLKYPAAAVENAVEGMCVVQFKVKKDGSVADAKLVRDIGAGCGQEALKIVQNMERDQVKWIAGKQRGKAQDVLYTLPVKFKLDGNFPHSRMAVQPSIYHQSRQFYTPKYTSTKTNQRSDFRSTIYWQSEVKTDKNGKAKVEFYTSDAITNFRATLEGFGNEGQIGRSEHLFFAQLPFSLDTKIPPTVLTGDLLNLAVTLTNNIDENIDGQLRATVPAHFEALEEATKRIQISAQSSKTIYLPYRIGQKIGKDKIRLRFESNSFSDDFVAEIETRSTGFKVAEVYGGKDLENHFILDTEQAVEGTLNAEISVYTNVLDEVLTGMERMLRQPNGCFEQTSSSNYPNLLVLQYLEKTGKLLPETKAKAEQYLDVGYKRLTSFECTTGGFEIFGRDPANVGLTAFGLMQFTDMAKVYPVDKDLLERTENWLMEQRDGKGHWTIKGNLRESSANAVNGAYITWAMCEAGKGDQIAAEIETMYQQALSSQDDYQIALMANALLSINDQRYKKLLSLLEKSQKQEGYWQGATASIMRSGGRGFQVETTALATLALLRGYGVNAQVERAMEFMLQSKNAYGFGSTQSTVLALKAIMEYAEQASRPKESGVVELMVNDKVIETVAYDKNHQNKIIFPNLQEHLVKGENKVLVRFIDTKTPQSVDVSLDYDSYVPTASETCPIRLTTNLLTDKSSVGKTVRLSTIIENTSNKNQASPIALIAIPSGLSLQVWQLKELLEQGKMDAYELFDGYLVLHYENIDAKTKKVVNLDLKADIAGTYQSPASYAYLYYNNEEKTWNRAAKIVIE